MAADSRSHRCRRGRAGPEPVPAALEAKTDPAVLVATLRQRAWESLGLERRRRRPERPPPRAAHDGGAGVRPSARARGGEARNLVAVAESMATGALFREESRGGHFRNDFPKPDDARFLGHTLLTADGPRLIPVDAVAASAA
jgi:succinate dehydrogenase/fumarate reductase flavoprotein subunit